MPFDPSQFGSRQARNQPADQLLVVSGPSSAVDPSYATEQAAADAAPGEHRAGGRSDG